MQLRRRLKPIYLVTVEMADRTHTADGNVENQVSNGLSKLSVENHAEAADILRRRRWV